jgi:hypothetical protein
MTEQTYSIRREGRALVVTGVLTVSAAEDHRSTGALIGQVERELRVLGYRVDRIDRTASAQEPQP